MDHLWNLDDAFGSPRTSYRVFLANVLMTRHRAGHLLHNLATNSETEKFSNGKASMESIHLRMMNSMEWALSKSLFRSSILAAVTRPALDFVLLTEHVEVGVTSSGCDISDLDLLVPATLSICIVCIEICTCTVSIVCVVCVVSIVCVVCVVCIACIVICFLIDCCLLFFIW